MSTRHFGSIKSLKGSLKVTAEEAAWIEQILLPNTVLFTAIELYNIARTRGWGRAEELALQAWRKLSRDRLATLIEEAKILYARSPSRTPERKAILSALRRLSGKKLEKAELVKLQEKCPKIHPRRIVRIYLCNAW